MNPVSSPPPPPLHNAADTDESQPPPAPWLPRILAFMMDGILVSAFGILLLTRILLPIHHSEGMHEFSELLADYARQSEQAAETGSSGPPLPDLRESDAITTMFAFAQTTLLLLFWAYFLANEWFLKGATLGKKTFGLQAVSAFSGEAPTLWECLLRTAFKSLALVGHPIMLINFVIALFNRDRRAGHDFLARTRVR